MKSIVHSSALRETLSFAGLLGAAVLLSAFISDPSWAAALGEEDTIEFVSDITGGEGDLKSLVNTILSYFLGFLGFVCVIMVIYGGILYVVSAGNEENVNKAKKILLYAAVGIIIIMISFALVSTILGAGETAPTTTGTGT